MGLGRSAREEAAQEMTIAPSAGTTIAAAISAPCSQPCPRIRIQATIASFERHSGYSAPPICYGLEEIVMAETARRIPISKDSELGRQLAEAREAGVAVVLEVDGYAYRFTPQPPAKEDIWKDYDPEKVREALRQSAGALRGIDRNKLLADLREERGQDSRGRPA